MEQIQLKLCRPYDREPGDHLYAEPFDSELDKFVGGVASWSSPRVSRQEKPSAKLSDQSLTVTLHEDGPVFEWLLQNWDQIPNLVNSLSAIVSAWYAARTFRRSQLPKDDIQGKRQIKINVSGVELNIEEDLTTDELAKLIKLVSIS